MTTNPMVVARTDTTSPLAGTGLLEDGEQLARAVRDGDWVSGGMAVFAGALDTVAAVSDPLGTLFAMGIGWVVDHVHPLNTWLEELTGDADQVAAFAGTWANVSAGLQESAQDLTRVVAADLAGMEGATVDAYRRLAADMAEHVEGASGWAGAVSGALEIASTLVQIVHDLVRDAIAQVLGAVASYAVELVATAGLAAPLVIEQAATRAAAMAARIGRHVTRLLTSFRDLDALLTALRRLFDQLGEQFGRLFPGRGRGDASPPPAPRPGAAQSVEDVEGWLGDVNPGFTGDPFDPRSNNCGRCTVSVHDALAGGPVVPAGTGTYSIAEMEALTSMPQVPMTPDEIADALRAGGAGSHAVVGIDRASGPGHWFNAYFDGTRVVAVDGQTGRVTGWPPDLGAVYWDAAVRRADG